jgi:5-methylcytosine-specific restriction endonuclease McrA
MLLRLDQIDLLKFGHTIQMAGAVYVGEGKVFLAMFPEDKGHVGDGSEMATLDMNLDDWQKFLRQTDLLETEIWTRASDGTLAKAIARKSQRQISQGVSWAVYKRDGYKCRYCADDDVPLTVDHLVLWEEGGPSIEANLVSACRRCNKTRGNTQYGAWLEHSYYRTVSKKLDPDTRQANKALAETLGSIPRQVHQPTHR